MPTILEFYSPPPVLSGSGKGIKSLYQAQNNAFYHCLWCSKNPLQFAIGLPVELVNNKVKVEQISSNSGEKFWIKEDADFVPVFKTVGIFCSLQCAKAHWQERRHETQYSLAGMFLDMVWKLEMGPAARPLAASPPRHLYKVFGGTLDWGQECELKNVKMQHLAQVFVDKSLSND